MYMLKTKYTAQKGVRQGDASRNDYCSYCLRSLRILPYTQNMSVDGYFERKIRIAFHSLLP